MFEIELSEEENFYKLQNMVLSSYPVLRKVFQTRWKKETGTDWEPTPEQGQEYIRGLGAVVYNKAAKVQKSLLVEGNLEDWDLTLLAQTILNLGDFRNYKVENDSVKKLRTLRNLFAHRTQSKLPRELFQANGKIFQESMKGLGVKDEVIDQIISTSGTTSSDAAFKMAKRLYDKAKIHIKKNKFERAIERCNEAIQLPSLLPMQKATTFLNRGECYLKFAAHKKYENRSESEGYIEEAIRDGNRALELCDNSWKAHYLIGRGHRMINRLENAIQTLTLALAISPDQKSVKEDLCTYKTDLGRLNSEDVFDPSCGPTTLKERLAKLKADTGRKVTPKQYVRQWKRESTSIQQTGFTGQVDYMKGLQYIGGLHLQKNEEEAVRYFTKAAIVGNPGALHSLGICYEDGTGVERDISKAFQLYLQGAETPIGDSGRLHPGVKSCQHNLGRMYESGIFVEQDISEAAKWYKKAADNGSSFAANNLGNLYMTGSGVARDEKMGVKYWTQAARSKDALALRSLMEYYIDHLEPEKASEMFEALKLGRNSILQGIDEDQVKCSIERIRVKRDKKKAALVAFEKGKRLDTMGLTFLERINRKLKSESREVEVGKCMCPNCFKDGDTNKEEINVGLIRSKAREGSVTAAAILKTLEISRNLIQFMEGKDSLKESQKLKVLNKLYECATLEFNAVRFPEHVKSKLKQGVMELVDSKCGKEGEEDMKIRFVHAKLNNRVAGKPSYSVELLKQGIRMYSENVHYYELLSSICVHDKDPESGFSYATMGLEKFPDNLNLLFFKALNQLEIPAEKMKMTDVQKRVAVITAYEEFLAKAPLDDWKVGEAYYGMSTMYLNDCDFERCKHFFKLGQKAEKNALLPRGTSEEKRKVEYYHQSIDDEVDPIRLKVINSVLPILQMKAYLYSPVRIGMITHYRQRINEQESERVPETGYTPKPKVTQKVPNCMFQLKPITLKEMNPTASHIYEDRVIDLTIIDVPNRYCHCSAIHLLAEDENGNVARLNIYNMAKSKENLEEFEFGTRIAILNPYMHIGESQMEIGVRVDCLDCLIFLGKVEDMCRFCGEENAPRRCSKCRTARYCSRQCEMFDWKIMHKLICSLC